MSSASEPQIHVCSTNHRDTHIVLSAGMDAPESSTCAGCVQLDGLLTEAFCKRSITKIFSSARAHDNPVHH